MLTTQRRMEGGSPVTVRPGKRSAREIVEELAEKWKPGRLHPELVLTDRIMQRWAVSVGDGMPDGWNDEPQARVPPLDDGTAILVDRIVMHQLTKRYQTLAMRWYKSRQPRAVISDEMGLPRTSLYLEWRSMLWYLRGHFHGVGIDC